MTYHPIYSVRRQRFQDEIVATVAREGSAQRRPWIVFTAGAMGAGKTHTMRWMVENGYFPLGDVVKLDPDRFKTLLPEWQQYISISPWTAGSNTHHESGLLLELTQQAALSASKHVWVDGSLRNSVVYSRLFDRIRQEFPQYRIAILHVFASDPETVWSRVQQRGNETGRRVPRTTVQASIKQVPASVSLLTPKANLVAHILNDAKPRLIKYVHCNNHNQWFNDSVFNLSRRSASSISSSSGSGSSSKISSSGGGGGGSSSGTEGSHSNRSIGTGQGTSTPIFDLPTITHRNGNMSVVCEEEVPQPPLSGASFFDWAEVQCKFNGIDTRVSTCADGP